MRHSHYTNTAAANDDISSDATLLDLFERDLPSGCIVVGRDRDTGRALIAEGAVVDGLTIIHGIIERDGESSTALAWPRIPGGVNVREVGDVAD